MVDCVVGVDLVVATAEVPAEAELEGALETRG